MKRRIYILAVSLFIIFSIGLSAIGCGKPDSPITPPDDSKLPTVVDPDGYLVKDGSTSYKIIIPEEHSDNEAYAANELASYIKLASGARIIVETDNNLVYNEKDEIISIGKTVYQKGADLSDVDYSKLKTGGYVIKNFGNVYIIDSSCKNGNIYGVYEFLERFFGIEFLTYDATYLPSNSTVKAKGIDLIDIPAFAVRDYYAYTAFYQGGTTFGAKMRNNSSRYADHSAMDPQYYYTYYVDYNGNSNWYTERMGHTITHLLSADAYVNGINPTPTYRSTDNGASSNWELGYFATNPEWYAYNPSYNRVNTKGYSQEEVCYTNGMTEDGEYDSADKTSLMSKMIEICKRMIIDDRNDGAHSLMLGHGDYSAKCECDKCTAAYEKYGTFSGVTCVWANAIVKEVKKWMSENNINREVQFVIFAYSKSRPAPVVSDGAGGYKPINEKVVLDKNISIQVAYRICNYHSVWDYECDQNEELRQQFTQWTMLADSVEIWDYQCCYTDYLWYLPNYATLRDNYLYYIDINVNRVLSQGTPSEGHYYDYHLHQWLCLKLMWNPNQNVNELIRHFNKLYFGEGYDEYVNLYLDVWENHFAALDAIKENGFHATTDNSLGFEDAENYSYELLDSQIKLIRKAIDKVKSDETLSDLEKSEKIKRFGEVIVTPEYMMLKLGYIVDSIEKKELATEFFTYIDMAGISQMAEGGGIKNSFAEWKKQFGLN